MKTVSGALHGTSAQMSSETRARIRQIAAEFSYVPNLAARAMRRGSLPLIGVLADGLITQPFATEIMRGLDNAARAEGLGVLVSTIDAKRGVDGAVAELERFVPQAIVYAAMYHKLLALPERVRGVVQLMINCRDQDDRVPALVPAEREAGLAVTAHLFERGRRAIAFLNLPGLVAGEMRAAGFRHAHALHGVAVREEWIRPATRGAVYNDRAHSLVRETVRDLMRLTPRPDAILCGNDRVALEVYGALRRVGAAIPDDVAVASFDNQVEIAARLDPPLTTMALPHRAMGRRAVEVVTGKRPAAQATQIAFHLVRRAST